MQCVHTFNLRGFVALPSLIGADSPVNSAISIDIEMYHFVKRTNENGKKNNRWELKITEQNAVNTNMYRPANTKRRENAATKVITTEVLFDYEKPLSQW